MGILGQGCCTWIPEFFCATVEPRMLLATCKNHRIIESLRLEETSKISKSNHHPNTTMSAKPCPEMPHLHVF